MDDEGTGKARRNLLLVSSVVVLGAWLELPLPDVVERVLGVGKGTSINEVRLWSAMLAMLAYLVYRFKYSEDAGESARVVRESWNLLCEARAEALLRRHLVRSASRRRDSPHFGTALNDFFEKHEREMSIDRTAGGLITPSDMTFVFKSNWKGDVSVGVQGLTHDGLLRGHSGTRLPFEVTKSAKRLWVQLPAAIELGLRSRATGTALVPVVMSMLAVFIAAFKLTTAALP